MSALRTRKPVEELPDEDVRKRVAEAEATIREIDTLDPAQVRGREDKTLARYRQALDVVEVGRAELSRRAHEAVVANAPLRRSLRERHDARSEHEKALRPVLSALSFVCMRAHPELAGARLAADRLSAPEGRELVELVSKAKAVLREEDAEPLSSKEQARYEVLLGIAADDEGVFARKRKEAAAKEKLSELAKARRRHPQAESLVAAVLGDPDLFDFLHERIRENVVLIDEHGRKTMGASTGRILEPGHVSTLFVVLSRISENGGRAVTINQYGAIGEGLPLLPVKSLRQLQRNDWLTVRAEGADFRVGVGSRVRTLAKKWAIAVPEGEPREATSA